jgi:hypothetical protein
MVTLAVNGDAGAAADAAAAGAAAAGAVAALLSMAWADAGNWKLNATAAASHG